MILQKDPQTLLQLTIEAPVACTCATCGADGCAGSGCELLAAARTGPSSDSDEEGSSPRPRAMPPLPGAWRGRVSKYHDVWWRPWGKWAAEIRNPHCTMRKWLDIFNTIEDAIPSMAPTSTYHRHHHLLQPLLESLHETYRSNASSPVHVALAVAALVGQHSTRLVPKEQDIWDGLNETMMMDDGSFWSSIP
uniref:AP2/ERF domain-containing protein n=1 Tax=Setaria viridis TaxID=4556 RepID=A0A4U6TYZ1_SETVI|nr:hypothetical protein SEVIR_7G039205v2 [Setaria viridis]